MAKTGESKTYDEAIAELVSIWKRKEEKRERLAAQKAKVETYQQELSETAGTFMQAFEELQGKRKAGHIVLEDFADIIAETTHVTKTLRKFSQALQIYTKTLEEILGREGSG